MPCDVGANLMVENLNDRVALVGNGLVEGLGVRGIGEVVDGMDKDCVLDLVADNVDTVSRERTREAFEPEALGGEGLLSVHGYSQLADGQRRTMRGSEQLRRPMWLTQMRAPSSQFPGRILRCPHLPWDQSHAGLRWRY